MARGLGAIDFAHDHVADRLHVIASGAVHEGIPAESAVAEEKADADRTEE